MLRNAMARWHSLTIVPIVPIVCLAVLVAVGSWLPGLARLMGGPAVHVCHCEVRGSHGHAEAEHEHCGCPICVPELRDHDGLGHAEVKGSCGDDDPGIRGLAAPAIASAGFVLAPPLASVAYVHDVPSEPLQWAAPPDAPPPRSLVRS